MTQMFFKTKNGTILLELLIVISIVIFMSLALFLISGNKNAALEVDSAAQQIAAQLRELQNDALNGRQIDGISSCLFKFGSDSIDTYAVSYYDCASPANLIKQMPAVKLKNVTVGVSALGAVAFSTPLGKPSGAVDVVITSINDLSVKMLISINVDGNIVISKI
jgi:type II secretory pathway pseudopilin PulG